jgi:Uma2 family endonuclease
MSTTYAEQEMALGPESAGILMTPVEFDAIESYDENYRYELVNGVLVVTPIPLAGETGPNELLGYYLYDYQKTHAKGSTLDDTLPQQYVRTKTSRRLADRLIWTGLGRLADTRRDVATIAVEFVSAGRRSQKRDYVDKRREYQKAGIREYWIIDRFQRRLTVIQYTSKPPKELVFSANERYRPKLLPGFEVPLAELLQAADRRAEVEE